MEQSDVGFEINQNKRRNSELSDLFTMSEVFAIKQEPELDIISEGEGDPPFITSNENENCVSDSDDKTLREGLDRQIGQDILLTRIKTEATKNENKWTKIRSFQCYMCSKSYTTKQMLKFHIHSIHMLLRPFKCEICLRSFADKYTLTTHGRIHSGERPYPCPFCTKTFRQHSALTKHKRIHTKEKPYQCDVCLKAFSDRSSLIPHRKIHTGELIWNRSFRCDVCNAGFVKNSHLLRHNNTKSHLKEAMKMMCRS